MFSNRISFEHSRIKGLGKETSNANIGSFDYDFKTKILWLSAGTKQILGLDQQQNVELKHVIALMHPQDVESVARSHREYSEMREPKAIELRIRRQDGSEGLVHMFGKVFFDASGAPVNVLGTVADIAKHDTMLKRVNRHRMFEKSILQLSHSFINRPLHELSDVIYDTIRSICNYCEADRIAIYRYDFANNTAQRMFDHNTAHNQNGSDDASIPFSSLTEAIAAHKTHKVYRASPGMQYQSDASSSDAWKSQQLYPIAADNDLMGFLMIARQKENIRLSDSKEIMLRIFAEILAATLQKEERDKILREAVEQNRLAMDAAGDSIVVFSRDGTILNTNIAFAESIQIAPEQALGANIRELLQATPYKDIARNRFALVEQVFNTAVPIVVEDQWNDQWFESRMYPVMLDDKVTAVSLCQKNITDRKKAEEQAKRNVHLQRDAEDLRKREQEYLELLDGSSEGSWIYDFQSCILEYSKSWGERFGKSDMYIEDIRSYMSAIIHPEDRERFFEQWADAISKRLPKYRIEYRVRTVQPKQLWVLDRSKILYNADGTPQKIYTTTTDITDQKNNEALLNRQNRILREINHIYEQAFASDSAKKTAEGCLDVVKSITQSPVGFVCELDQNKSLQTVVFSCPGHKQPDNSSLFYQMADSHGFIDSVLREGKPVMNNALHSDPAHGFPQDHPNIGSFLCVPYLRDGKVLGMIGLANRAGGYRQIDLEMLETLTPTVFEVLSRKKAEEELRESRNILQTVIESAPDPIYLKDCDSRILLANSAFGNRRVGMDLQKLIGRTAVESLDDKETAQRYIEADRRMLGLKRKEEVEEEIPTVSGLRTYITSRAPWFDSNGEIVGIICISRDITERKKMEEELRESEKKYRTLFNSIDEAFCIVEVLYDESNQPYDFKFLETNPAFQKHSGTVDVVGRSMREIDSRLEDIFYPMLDALLRSGEPARFEGESKALNRWFDVYAFKIEGQQNRVGVLFSDISGRKTTEAELLKNESLLRSIIEGTADSIFLKDKQGRILMGNSAFAKGVGKPIEELIGKTSFDYRPREVAQKMFDADRRIMEADREELIEEKVPSSDGSSIRTVSTIKAPWHNESGEVIGLIGVSHDISTRVRMEEALRRNEALLRSVIEGITDFIYLKDRQGRLIMANSAFSRVVGVPVEQMIGKSVYEYRSSHDIAVIIDAVDQRIMESDTPEVIEQLLPTPDGLHMNTFLTTKVPWHNEKGEVIGIIGVSREITDRKKMEEELKKTAQDLERKNRLITDFFTNMTHELKTPLTIILVQLELMGLYLDDVRKIPELIDSATQNSYRLLRLVGNLLDITRIDGGHLRVATADADAVALVQSICETVDAYAKAKSIRLTFTSAIKEKMMPLDVEKTERILLNLLSNAIKYTEPNGRITVRLDDKYDEGIALSVEDNGVGIPEDKLEVIFDRFAQVDSSLSKQAEGCGIGLALVKSLVQMLGGTIRVKSKPGKGSNFTVTLPMLSESHESGINMYDMNLAKKAEMELSDLNLAR